MPASFLLQPNVDALYDKEHDHGRHDRAPAVADKGECHPCQGNQLNAAPHCQENLKDVHDADTVDDHLVKAIPYPYRHRHHHYETADHDQYQADTENNTQLLTHRRKDEIGIHLGDFLGIPL